MSKKYDDIQLTGQLTIGEPAVIDATLKILAESSGDIINVRNSTDTFNVLQIENDGRFHWETPSGTTEPQWIAGSPVNRRFNFGLVSFGGTPLINSGSAYFAHVTRVTGSGYALLQDAIGDTTLNAETGRAIRFRVGNNNAGIIDANLNIGLGIFTGLGARLHIKGSGAGAGTKSFLVSNSNDYNMIEVLDQGAITFDSPAGNMFFKYNGTNYAIFDVNLGGQGGRLNIYAADGTSVRASLGGNQPALFNTASAGSGIQLQKNGTIQAHISTTSTSGAEFTLFAENGADKVVHFNSQSGGEEDYINTGRGLGIGTVTPALDSVLDVISITRGFLPPRMNTTQRNALGLGSPLTPTTGLTIYNNTTNDIEFYNGTSWIGTAGDGDGIYGGSGTVPTTTTITLTDTLNFINAPVHITNGQKFAKLVSGGAGGTFQFHAGGDTNADNFSITNNTDGFYFVASSASGGVGGRVGIGTGLNPPSNAKLTVRGTTTGTSRILSLRDSGNVEKVIIEDSGKVGVGLAAPAASVHIQGVGNTSSTNSFRVDSFNSLDNMFVVRDDGTVFLNSSVTLFNEKLHIETAGVGILVKALDATANVFIGSNSVGATIHNMRIVDGVGIYDILNGPSLGGTYSYFPNIAIGGAAVGAPEAGYLIEQRGNTLIRTNLAITVGVQLLNSPSFDIAGKYDSDAGAGVTEADFISTLSTIVTTAGAAPLGYLDFTINGTQSMSIHEGQIGIGTVTPADDGILDISSVTKGFLAPRMTTAERDLVGIGSPPTPTTGMLVYNIDTNKLNIYNGTVWTALETAAGGADTLQEVTDAGATSSNFITVAGININGQLKKKRTVVSSSTYTILATDNLIAVTYTAGSPAGSVTLQLPAANTVGDTHYIIVDEGGNASVNNITISAGGADNIIGQATFVMNGDYDSLTLYSDGANGWFIY